MNTRCYFCDRLMPDTIKGAVDAGWMPSFYEAGAAHETEGPVCPTCCEEHLEIAEDGELQRVTE